MSKKVKMKQDFSDKSMLQVSPIQ